MSSMKHAFSAFLIALSIAVGAGAPAFSQAATGSVDFVARATPSGGLDEPVRGFPFYLLSKSFEQISNEAEASFPKSDMDAFIAKLEVSKELKAWMKKNQTVQLSGEEFVHKLKPADVMDTPEFFDAFMDRHSGSQGEGFPKPKYKPSDKTKDPAKYDKLKAEYLDAIRHFMEVVPDSLDGIDISLAAIDPGHKWSEMVAARNRDIHRRALDLAQSKYLVARADTDLQGQGYLRGLPPGNYWLSTLDVSASVGDARPRWDTPITVAPGQQVHIILSNINAVETPGSTAAP
jgi:hypothetical protein